MRTEFPSAPNSGMFLQRLAVCVIFVLALLFLPALADDPGLRAVIPGFVALIFLQLAPVLFTRRPDLFEPVMYVGVMAAFATIAQLASFYQAGSVEIRLVPGLDPDQAADLASMTLWVSCVGLLAFYAGYYHPTWGKGAAKLYPRLHRVEWDPNRLLIASILILVVWLGCYAYFQVRIGAPLFSFKDLGAGKEVWRNDPTMSWMIRGVQLGVIPIYMYLAAAAARRQDKQTLIWMGILGVMSLLILRLGQRGLMFMPILGAFMIIHYLRRRIPVWVFAGALFVASAANMIMLEWRSGEDRGYPEDLSTAMQRPAESLAAHEDDRQRFGALAVIINEFPDKRPYLLGESWLGLVAQPIPRWLWPSKGQHFAWRDTQIVKNITGAPIPSSYLATLFANFGWLGIVIGMFIWGVVQRGMYEWLLPSRGDPNIVMLYSTFVLYFGFTLLNMSSVIQFTLPLYVLIRWVAGKVARAPQPASA